MNVRLYLFINLILSRMLVYVQSEKVMKFDIYGDFKSRKTPNKKKTIKNFASKKQNKRRTTVKGVLLLAFNVRLRMK